ncbi:hypothetical protein D9M70_527420 [compost metagenome]
MDINGALPKGHDAERFATDEIFAPFSHQQGMEAFVGSGLSATHIVEAVYSEGCLLTRLRAVLANIQGPFHELWNVARDLRLD